MRTLLIALLVSLPALGHEFWLEPADFRPEVGESVPVRIFIGDGFPGDPYGRNPRHIESFTLADGEMPVALKGAPRSDPAGHFTVRRPGHFQVAYRSRASFVMLPAKKFEAYLKEEGLDAALAERKRRGERNRAGLELYSRCAKTLLATPDSDGAGFDRRLGLPLELIPLKDPAKCERLPVRLEHHGKPLAGALVKAFRKEGGAPLHLRTNEAGLIEVPLANEGVWMLSAVHMRRLPPGTRADWESTWASLTFRPATR